MTEPRASAHEEAGARERALLAGAVAFVRKPFTDETLIGTLRAALGGARGAP